MATIKWNENLKRFILRYDAGYDGTGKRIQKTKRFKKKRDAENFLFEQMSQIGAGAYVEPQRKFLCDYLAEWLEDQEDNLSPTTYSGYEVNIRCHINPIIGGVRLQDLKPYHIRKLYKQLQKERELKVLDKQGKTEKRTFQPLSTTSVVYVHRVLSKALEDALKDELIMKNPAKLVEPPSKEKYEAKFLTVEQIKELLATLKENNDELYLPVMLAATLGLRRGEALGLQWKDIDFKSKMIRIRSNYTMANGKPVLREKTKTDASRRDIVVTERLLKELESIKKSRKVRTIISKDFVCAWADGKPINPSHLSRAFNLRLTKYGFPKMRFHDLRHSNAAIMINQGAPMKAASDRLGHSTIQVTQDIYGHVERSVQEQIAESIEKAIWGS